MQILKVNNKEAGQRIDKYIRKYLNNAPLSYIYKLFRKKEIKVNGKHINIDYLIKENDEITIYISDNTLNDFKENKTLLNKFNSLDIIYEDENILVINKNEGILVHEGEDNLKTSTLNQDILGYLKSKGEYRESDLFTPSCTHRLDRNTSGVIIASKNLKASQELLELFKDKTKLKKEYLALVVGKTNAQGTIDKPLLKDEKKKIVKVDTKGLTAITKYQSLTFNENYSLLKVNILTGRTHQIRVHLSSINHPLINDDKYGNFKENKIFSSKYHYKYQFLHSYKITFTNIEGFFSYLNNHEFIAPIKKEKVEIIHSLFPNFSLTNL